MPGSKRSLWEHSTTPAEVLVESDLVVSRAGATTLAELSVAATPAIVVPFPDAADDHQLANARLYAEGGACRVIDEETVGHRLDAELATHLGSLLADNTTRGEMANAMLQLARPRAADDIAGMICDLTHGRAIAAAIAKLANCNRLCEWFQDAFGNRMIDNRKTNLGQMPIRCREICVGMQVFIKPSRDINAKLVFGKLPCPNLMGTCTSFNRNPALNATIVIESNGKRWLISNNRSTRDVCKRFKRRGDSERFEEQRIVVPTIIEIKANQKV